MRRLEETYNSDFSLACTGSWESLPLFQELRRTGDWTLYQKDDHLTLSQLLESHDIRFALCSVDRIIKNLDFELALPVGVVVHGPCSLAYFSSENCEELKDNLKPRIAALKEVFAHANLSRSYDMRDSAKSIWEASKNLVEPRLKLTPYIRFSGGCGLFTSLARVMYRLLFGESAYQTNCMLQGPSGHAHNLNGRNLEFRQGNDAIARKCQQRNSIDLIELWSDLTQMPFVSAVVQKSEKCHSSSSRNKLLEIAELAQAKMKVEPANYLPDILPVHCNGHKIDLSSVWKNISYRLCAEDLKSLLLFLNLARSVQKKSFNDDEVAVKLLRWQQQDATSRLLQ